MNPKVSIIVPCWGVEKYLDQCVESLINQTLKDIEIILVDDESPDRVPEMCDEWANRDSRIKVIHKKNEGLGMACNSGIEIATGDYIAFCDSDDWVDLDTYEVMYNSAIENHADMILTSFKYVDMDGNPLHNKSLTYKDCCYFTDEIKYIMKGMIASVPSDNNERQFQVSAKVTLYRRALIETNVLRFVSERIIPSEDLLFNLDYLSYSQKVITLSQKFYNYRYNPISITHKFKKDSFLISKNLFYYLEKKVSSLQLGEDGLTRVRRMFIAMTRAYVMLIIKSDESVSTKKKLLNEICKDKTLKEVELGYPTKLMPFKHRIFLWATTHNLQLILKLLTRR